MLECVGRISRFAKAGTTKFRKEAQRRGRLGRRRGTW